MTKPSFRNSFRNKFNKKFKLFFLFSKTLPGELAKLAAVIVIVLLLSWGISSATGDDFEQATKNFSVIGTVSALSDTTISLIDSRGSDTTVEELYNLNIEHLTKIETKEYQPLIISDVQIGDTIIAQGVTDGSTFFITRVVSFSSTPLPPLQEIATTTPEFATTTEDVATSTDVSRDSSSETTTSEELATTTPTEEVATSTEETTQEDTASTTETVIDTMTDIIEDGVDQASDVLDIIIDTITGSEEPAPPVEESTPTPQAETQTESPPTQ
jgi:hypothetical protein